jgi:surfactin family lipopeptide synthetase A/lichenysin synthetase A
MQKAVAAIWREVLGVERVGLHDNFFDIGGHSLLGVRVISRIEKQLGVRLNQAIMVLQTLEQIAQECERRAGTIVAAEPSRETPVQGLGRKLFSAVRDAVFHD